MILKQQKPNKPERKQLGGIIKSLRRINPIVMRLQQILKPTVQIKDIPTQGKNKLRNYILREAEQSGTYTKISDQPTNTTKVLLDANNGRNSFKEWLSSPNFGSRAEKLMSREQAYKLGKFESSLLDVRKAPLGFNPLKIYTAPLKGAAGTSVISNATRGAVRKILIDPVVSKRPMYTAIHESAHASTLNYNPTNGWRATRNLFDKDLMPLLDKQLENSQRLANQLEIDPKKYSQSIEKIKQQRNLTTQQAKDLLDKWIIYAKDPQEARARGLAAVLYNKNNNTKNIPVDVDGGQSVFTDASLDNLYKNIFSIITPAILYETQN